jgi:predicted TIM-barrel fold metal-dependent hydrolase
MVVAKPAAARRAKPTAKPAAKSRAETRPKPGPKRPVAPRAAGRTIVASQPRTPVGFRIPPGACDCHVHVFAAATEFPFAPARGYTPPPASADELLALQNALSLSRVVIVQPSVYGTDNSCTLDGMRRLGPERARGVAVIDNKTTAAALKEMHAAGIRGVRVNLETGGETDPNVSRRNLAAAVKRVAPLGWHVQVYTRLSVVEALHDDVMKLDVPIVFDHFGGAQAADGVEQPGFAALGAGSRRQGLCQGVGPLSQLGKGASLRRCRAARPGTHRRQPRPHRLGHRLAASASRAAGQGIVGDHPGVSISMTGSPSRNCRAGRRPPRLAPRSSSIIPPGFMISKTG